MKKNNVLEMIRNLLRCRDEACASESYEDKAAIECAFEESDGENGEVIERAQAESGLSMSSSDEVMMRLEGIQMSMDAIEESANEISRKSKDQTDSVEKTVKVMWDMNQYINDIEKSSIATSENSRNSYEKAVEGERLISDFMIQFERINDIVEDSNKRIRDFYESSEKIKDFTKTIGEISKQSNLLAVNASIEAARAGAEGSGFAVVAREIQNLSQSSKQASISIEEIIQGNSHEMRKIFEESQKQMEEMKKALRLMDVVNKSFNSICGISEKLDIEIANIKKLVHSCRGKSENLAEFMEKAKEASILSESEIQLMHSYINTELEEVEGCMKILRSS